MFLVIMVTPLNLCVRASMIVLRKAGAKNGKTDEYQKSDVKIGHTYFLRDRRRGYEDVIVEHFIFQVVPILREYVKDGIFDVAENLIPTEHTASEIHSATSGDEQITMLSENIMLYVKEFGNLNKSNAIIDNAYIGAFIDNLRREFSY